MSAELPFQDRARASGLTAGLVRQVVVRFYDEVKTDSVLGPVFSEVIGEDWDQHIERIVQFWLTATRLGNRSYDGRNFIPAHAKHPSIRSDLLPRWLNLFRTTALAHCSADGASVLNDIAERMAETLSISLSRRDSACAP
jgi:hemoglobin